jgi:hypothetical protein
MVRRDQRCRVRHLVDGLLAHQYVQYRPALAAPLHAGFWVVAVICRVPLDDQCIAVQSRQNWAIWDGEKRVTVPY